MSEQLARVNEEKLRQNARFLYLQWLVIFIAGLWRGYLFLKSPDWVSPLDDYNWVDRGLAFASGGVNDAWRAPGETLLIGFAARLTNEHFGFIRLLHGALMWAWLLPSLIIARRLLAPRSVITALGLIGFWPEFIAYGNLMLSEALAGFLLLSAVALFAIAIDSPDLGWRTLILYMCSGFMWGLLAITRDSFFYVGIATFIYLGWHWRHRGRSGLVPLGLLVLAAALPIAGWTARNHYRGKGLTVISNNGAYNLMIAWSGLNRDEVRAEYFGWPPKERSDRAKARAMQGLRENPGHAISRIGYNLPEFFLPDDMTFRLLGHPELPPTPPPGARLLLWMTLLIATTTGMIGLTLATISSARMWRESNLSNNQILMGLMVIICLALLGMHALVWMQPRYRIPITPFLFFFVLCGWAKWRTAEKWHYAVVALVIFATLVSVWLSRRHYLIPIWTRGVIASEIPAENKLDELRSRHFEHTSVVYRKRALEYR